MADWLITTATEKMSFLFPWQDGRSMCPVCFYGHTLAAEPVEHRAGHHCASLPLECWEMLRRLQRSPGQRMRRLQAGHSGLRAFIFESLIFKSKIKSLNFFHISFGQSPTVSAGPFSWLHEALWHFQAPLWTWQSDKNEWDVILTFILRVGNCFRENKKRISVLNSGENGAS